MVGFEEFSATAHYAHPGEKLNEHLGLVGEINAERGKRTGGADFEKLFRIVGIFHDAGKYTKFFQYHLHTRGDFHRFNDAETADFVEKHKSHASFGAALFVDFMHSNRESFPEELFDVFLLGGFVAIIKHHGNLDDVDEIISAGKIKTMSELFSVQREHIDTTVFQSEISKLLSGYHFDFEKSAGKIIGMGFQQFSGYMKKTAMKCRGKSILVEQIYEALIYSDKYKSIFGEKEITDYREKLGISSVDDYKKTFPVKTRGEDALVDMRNDIYRDVSEKIAGQPLSDHVYLLNTPTGSGKTLNLLNVGLKINEKLSATGLRGKIVYALPFTSIIDQVYGEMEKICGNSGISMVSNLILKHHHLTEHGFDEGEDYTDDETGFLVNSWESDIVLTTFFQVFHTIFGNRNKLLVKKQSFRNAVFLLDEVQSLPHKYWRSINDFIRMLTKEYNCYFVLSSATIPLLYDGLDAVELCNGAKYFDGLDRTEINFSSYEKMDMDKLYGIVSESLESNPGKSHLITLNTIANSVDMFDRIKSGFPERKVRYMSTNILPARRKGMIAEVKSGYGKGEILVSTPIIEAGVDIDFDIGFRDICPIDNLVQFIGRLNRNDRGPKGVVNVFELVNPKGKRFAEFIYDPLSMSITDDILATVDTLKPLSEKNYKTLFDTYFQLVKNKLSDSVYLEIRSAWENMEFEKVSGLFKLIDDDYEKVDMFVDMDGSSREVFEKYEVVRSIKDKWKRKRAWSKIKPEFMQYVISVAKKKIEGIFGEKDFERGFLYLSGDLAKRYYSEETGFSNVQRKDDFFI